MNVITILELKFYDHDYLLLYLETVQAIVNLDRLWGYQKCYYLWCTRGIYLDNVSNSNSFNMGTSDLPDMYVQSLQAKGIHSMQILSTHVITNTYITLCGRHESLNLWYPILNLGSV